MIGITLRRLAAGFAIAAGILFSLLALLVLTSVAGRFIFLLPVPGDFEIVGMGTAIAVFLCLPYCQLQRGNVTVDLFATVLSKNTQACLDILAAGIYALLALLFAWRMSIGLADMLRQGDITVILGIPLWLVFPFAVVSFLLLALCCLYNIYETLGTRQS